MSLFSASFFSMIFGGFGSSFFFSSAAKAGAIRKAHSGSNVQRNERIILDPLYTSQQEPWFIPHPPVYLPLTVRTNRKIEQRGPVRERLLQWVRQGRLEEAQGTTIVASPLGTTG